MWSTRKVTGFLILVIAIPTLINLFTSDRILAPVEEWGARTSLDSPNWSVVAAIVAVLILINHLVYWRKAEIARLTANHEAVTRSTAEKHAGEIERLNSVHREATAKLADRHSAELKEAQAQIHFRDQKILNLNDQVDDAAQLRFIDDVTGISNESKWKHDVVEYAKEASVQAEVHVALIDLIGFGQLNDEFGYQKVDAILRHLARTLDENLRKNEGFYKRRLMDEGMLPDRLYRKYPGGDEFYVIAKGKEGDLVGLLWRLQKLITDNVDEYIEAKITGRNLRLSFAGAICRLHRGEDAESVTARLIELIRKTRFENAPMRVIWESRKKSENEANPLQRVLYERAELLFANDPA